jgi:hypothetical protein
MNAFTSATSFVTHRIANAFYKGVSRRAALMAAAAAGIASLGMAPATASAHRDRDRCDADIVISRPCSPVIETREAQIWVEPVYRTVCEDVVIPPTCHTVSERVWIEPRVRSVGESVFVPERWEERTVVRDDHCGRPVNYRTVRVLVEKAHYETRCHDEVVVPGHFEIVDRQVPDCAPVTRRVERRELVTPGHFECRRIEGRIRF